MSEFQTVSLCMVIGFVLYVAAVIPCVLYGPPMLHMILSETSILAGLLIAFGGIIIGEKIYEKRNS